MTRASVLAARGTVVVGSATGSIVVVVPALEERVVRCTVSETTANTHATAAITITESRFSCGVAAAERHGDRVSCRVTAAHRLAPVAVSHDNSFRSRAEKVNSPQSGASFDASSC